MERKTNTLDLSIVRYMRYDCHLTHMSIVYHVVCLDFVL